MSERPAAPGDLGRRVAQRRGELGLDRRQLADRAGIDPGYLDYLEASAASASTETVHKLAAALETSSEELLGGTMDLPPGRGRPGPHPVLEKLEPAECLRLIAPGGVGRVAFSGPEGPTILPVNYVVHDGAVIFRTASGGPLDDTLRTGVRGMEFKVAFEIDRLDEAGREGWSVLVRGGAHHVSDEERTAVAEVDVRPWAGGERELFVRIAPTEISGRRIRHAS
ncbi:helix-turn-helix domain-containing protein [Streptosporangium sandarakinum]|uniref:Nitroimidazol reductase NimA-like FMN-containing flavoprotein (Pyridoxamine 5'-phosphate oxidase superfamily) n=1 Tax=Streptosporangium sandarakinum TaxID=1260955 RepID=A0A852VE72_9ACTN|nr:pyridoxamine 5'-phosphate oxidase family protein [Streptosporangium sandarakinum]NYF44485.1 nitroimidazol reductase NimA-like FMN-containing flavoprotein (pyridoxamine 5'-phosphate oxidase superfamily) [Streptosporangium sandarakinum]